MVLPVFPLCQKGGMKYQGEHKDREISPRTVKNFYYAKTHEFKLGRSVYHINFHTDTFRLFPKFERQYTHWWEFGELIPVRIVRVYWGVFGFAQVKSISQTHYERRVS